MSTKVKLKKRLNQTNSAISNTDYEINAHRAANLAFCEGDFSSTLVVDFSRNKAHSFLLMLVNGGFHKATSFGNLTKITTLQTIAPSNDTVFAFKFSEMTIYDVQMFIGLIARVWINARNIRFSKGKITATLPNS